MLYRRLLVLLAFLTLAGGALAEPAPDFTLPSNAGTPLHLADLRGKVVMINFWATWCGPCRKEMPLLDEIYQRYQSLGFELLGVNVESDSAPAKKWLQDMPVSFPVLFDTESKATKAFQVVAMPSTVLIGRDGEVRYVHHGYVPGDENEYQDQIRSLVRE